MSSARVLPKKGHASDFAKWLHEIAGKWQREWREKRIFEADPDLSREKFFITAAFPYPNSPLHLGHSRTYTIADVYARFMRMQGFNVLFPMGFHYTGTPIITMADAIANGDRELIELMTEVYGVPEEDIEKLKDPLSLARYFHQDAKNAMIEAGYSIDWRREFTTIDPEFKRFIIWQYTKLRGKGLITRGTHPVGWCPVHNMPVGMHDTKNDVEPEIGEFNLMLFRLDDYYMPAATLRPETVFGVTNVWVNPRARYVKAIVDGRKYIVSERAAFKLKFQRDSVEIVETTSGEELVGKRVVNPATGRSVPILPADFVDPDTATGVVMSVPAHAPYDYVALKEVVEERRDLLERLGISAEELKPIPLIKVEGYGEIPAKDIVERMGIKSQYEKDKLDEATKKLYSDEYHNGVVREDIVDLVYPDLDPATRKFAVAPVAAWIAGARVSDAREATARWLSALGLADKMYEIMNRPVYCRCGNEIVVKVLKDQWFIDYGNEEWKSLARELLASMRILPPEMRAEFEKTIDWLHERAVARTRGLGTELPWAKGWIIESLSDSTIYMAFYTVIHKIRAYGIPAEKLTVEFWDYVLHGHGDPEELSRRLGISGSVLEELRSEFDYWYPLDSRHSGRDLVPNHLTFFIFHHAALFPRNKWPRQIVVNGFVLYEGKKMSKSLRNIVPLRWALRYYGPDTVRTSLMASAELLQDANFSDELARSVLSQFARITRYVEASLKPEGDWDLADDWLVSKLQGHIDSVTSYMKELRTRAATIELVYEMENDVAKYLSIRGSPGPALREYMEKWLLMLAPIAPHLAEELWHRLGRESFISTEHWPVSDRSRVKKSVELAVAYVDRLVEDIKSIVRATKTEAKKVVIVVAKPERWAEARAVAEVVKKKGQLRDAVRSLISQGLTGKRAAETARRLYDMLRQESSSYVELIAGVEEFDEKRSIDRLADYIRKRVGAERIEVYYEDEAPSGFPSQKLKQLVPARPAILVE